MKRTLKTLVALVFMAAIAAGGFFGWKTFSEQGKNGETNAASAEDAASAPAPAVAAYDLSVQPDGLSKAVATLTLESGDTIKWRFYVNEAPNTAKRIAQLIAEGFYNGIVIHRVEPGFVVQAGDPSGTGAGGSGVKLKAEFNALKHELGIVSMARLPSDVDSADSQFFIMLGSTPDLDGKYTIFAKVVEGIEHVQKIQRGDKIKSFTIE